MKPIITVKYVNEGEHRRYFIHNRVGQYWTGREWSSRRSEAVLYENLQLCHEDYQRLITASYTHLPIQHFEVITHIIVRSSVPVTKKQVRKYIKRANRASWTPTPQPTGQSKVHSSSCAPISTA